MILKPKSCSFLLQRYGCFKNHYCKHVNGDVNFDKLVHENMFYSIVVGFPKSSHKFNLSQGQPYGHRARPLKVTEQEPQGNRARAPRSQSEPQGHRARAPRSQSEPKVPILRGPFFHIDPPVTTPDRPAASQPLTRDPYPHPPLQGGRKINSAALIKKMPSLPVDYFHADRHALGLVVLGSGLLINTITASCSK